MRTRILSRIAAIFLTGALGQVGAAQAIQTSAKPETSAGPVPSLTSGTLSLSDAEMAERVRQEFRHAHPIRRTW